MGGEARAEYRANVKSKVGQSAICNLQSAYYWSKLVAYYWFILVHSSNIPVHTGPHSSGGQGEIVVMEEG